MFYPESREALQAIVRGARERGSALVPVSSGAPHLHGASENSRADTVSFERMNKILKIDRKNRYVRAEAGVTFGELIPRAREAGLRLNIPFLPRAGKSAAASALEREAVLVPKYQYDYTDPLLNVEAVFGTGDVFRTGSASGPGPYEELKADMVNPWGPGGIDYLRFLSGAQGTIGLVTWVTLKAEVLPGMSSLSFIEADDPAVLTRLANALLRRRVVDDCVILNNVNFAAALSQGGDEARAMRRSAAPWTFICRVCGFERYPERRIEIFSKYLDEECRVLGLRRDSEPRGLDGIGARVEAALCDCDRRETYWKLRRGGEREILFLTPPSAAPSLLGALAGVGESCGLGGELGITVQPQVQGRAFRIECDVFFDMSSASESARADDFCYKAQRELFLKGAYFDRPYGSLANMVYAADPASADALRKIKRVFDPDGIFNPGKLCF